MLGGGGERRRAAERFFPPCRDNRVPPIWRRGIGPPWAPGWEWYWLPERKRSPLGIASDRSGHNPSSRGPENLDAKGIPVLHAYGGKDRRAGHPSFLPPISFSLKAPVCTPKMSTSNVSPAKSGVCLNEVIIPITYRRGRRPSRQRLFGITTPGILSEGCGYENPESEEFSTPHNQLLKGGGPGVFKHDLRIGDRKIYGFGDAMLVILFG